MSEEIVIIAEEQLGTTEVPVNKTKYGKWYGLDGNPWCAMFVSWVYAQAGRAASPWLAAPIVPAPTPGFASRP